MFCGNYILSGIFDKCYIFIRKNKNVEVITPTFIIQPEKGTVPILKPVPLELGIFGTLSLLKFFRGTVPFKKINSEKRLYFI